ncbi:MAG: TSUP family transporter [Rhodobacteraceae bacterium]|nr:TSUP family transporter [Paracoccaceae bacterium]
MATEYLIYLAAGAAAGGFINGLAGFGTALLALGFWLQIMPPVMAVSMVVVMSVATGLQGVWVVRHALFDHPKRLARFAIPGLVGVPLGVAALAIIEPQFLKVSIGGMMVIYGGFFAFRKSLPQLAQPTPVRDSVIGFLGGVLGGATSLSGALPTMWCALRPWSKSETRAVLQPYNMVILSIAALLFLLRGHYTWGVVQQLLLALPVSVLSAQVGLALFKRLSDSQFRRLLIMLMFISGVILLGKALV